MRQMQWTNAMPETNDLTAFSFLTAPTPEDERWMRRALKNAEKAWRLSPPNPSVGAVIVRGGEVLGEGFTQQTGGPHAEVMALRDAAARGNDVRGAVIYVTLEPCSHYGRTPPCAKALIEHGLGRVVAAVLDPNPAVAGRGLRMIAEAGIPVTCGVLEHEARLANAGFLKRMTKGTPWVRLKVAATLDGRTALPDGRSFWITGEAARRDGQFWRARSGAVVTGIGTVLADDPQMTVRLSDQVRFPIRVVVDAKMETPVAAKILAGGGTVIVAAEDNPERRAALEAAGAEVIVLPDAAHPERVDLGKMLLLLGERAVNDVHLEAGAGLNGAFLAADLVDEIVLYTAPCFFGSGRPIASLPLPDSPGAAQRWQIDDTAKFDDDLRLILRRKS